MQHVCMCVYVSVTGIQSRPNISIFFSFFLRKMQVILIDFPLFCCVKIYLIICITEKLVLAIPESHMLRNVFRRLQGELNRSGFSFLPKIDD